MRYARILMLFHEPVPVDMQIGWKVRDGSDGCVRLVGWYQSDRRVLISSEHGKATRACSALAQPDALFTLAHSLTKYGKDFLPVRNRATCDTPVDFGLVKKWSAIPHCQRLFKAIFREECCFLFKKENWDMPCARACMYPLRLTLLISRNLLARLRNHKGCLLRHGGSFAHVNSYHKQ